MIEAFAKECDCFDQILVFPIGLRFSEMCKLVLPHLECAFPPKSEVIPMLIEKTQVQSLAALNHKAASRGAESMRP
jgi:hypothetical protein